MVGARQQLLLVETVGKRAVQVLAASQSIQIHTLCQEAVLQRQSLIV
jgi:hypothetical protein